MSSPACIVQSSSSRAFSRTASVIVTGVGILGLTGWLFDIANLKSVWPGMASMKANTAFAFLLSGIALWFTTGRTIGPGSRHAGRWCAIVVALLGLLTLVEYLSGRDLGFDELLFEDDSESTALYPGRMALATALNFLLLGAAMALLAGEGAYWLAQSLAAIALLNALLALVGYMYGVESLYKVPPFSSVAFHTAGAFVLLSGTILAARADQGFMAVVTSKREGGITARRLLPAALILPILFGWLRLMGQHAGYYGTEFGLAIFALSNVVVFTILTLWSASAQDRMGAERTRAEERFQAAVESAPNGIMMVDRDGRIALVNKQTEKLFGYTRTEMLGQLVEMLVPERFRASHPDFRTSYFADPSVRAMGAGRNLHALRKDGREFPVEIGLTPVKTEQGLFVLCAIVDISERRRAEERFQAAVESAPNGIVMIDRDGRIILVNAQTEKLFGYSRTEMLDHSVEMLIPERLRARHPSFRANYFADPSMRAMGTGRDLFGRRKDGSEFPVEIGLTPVKTEEGIVVLSVIVDISERKRAEEALRTSEERLRQAQQAASVGTFEWNIQTGVNIWSPELEALHGLNPGEFAKTQQGWEQLVHPEDRAEAVGRVKHALTTGLPEEGEWRVVWPDGSVHWIAGRFQAFKDQAGKPLRLTGVNLDITARKHIDEERQKFVALANSSQEFIGMCDRDFKPFYVNPAGLRLVGLVGSDQTLEEALARACRVKVQDFFFPEDQAYITNEFFPRVLRDGHAEVEIRFRHFQSARPIWMIYNVFNIQDARGATIGWATVSRNIHDRKRAEEALRDSEERFNAFMQASPVIAWIKDDGGRHLYANKALEKAFGLRQEDIIGKTEYDLLPANVAEKLRLNDLEVLRTGKAVEAIEETGELGGKNYFWNSVKFPFQGSSGRRLVGGMAVDVTRMKQAEEEIHRLNTELEARVRTRTAELEAANKELEAFSYSVSHDLRAPLRAIDGFSRILLEEYEKQVPPEVRTYLQDVRANTQQMGHLVDDLLAFSRLSRQPMKLQTVRTGPLVRQCLEELRGVQEGRQLDIRVGDLPQCLADPSLLKQVWLNLLANALKYTAKREVGVVEIGCKNGNEQPVFFIKDNGVGFDIRYAHKLFGVFQRLHRSEEYEGTGIGLSIVQRIIHRHGGKVWADARPDQGATFFFTLAPGGSSHDERRG